MENCVLIQLVVLEGICIGRESCDLYERGERGWVRVVLAVFAVFLNWFLRKGICVGVVLWLV